MSDLLLAIFGGLAVAFAVLVIVARQPMRAALALVAHMVCLAGVYATLAVHVVALFQVLIYVGAVMVFMVYTIMLLDDRDASYRRRYSAATVPAIVVVALVSATLLGLVLRAGAGTPPPVDAPPSYAFGDFAVGFMQHYWFHFELATVLLLVGLIAAWTAVRESRR
jgi:NADH-quinone oxidoreductase subunit J